MKSNGKLFDRISLEIDLPSEVLPGMPLVEMLGDSRVIIENHNGVTHYNREEICVKVAFGRLRICGCGLALAKMSKRQLVIIGRIDGISTIRGRC